MTNNFKYRIYTGRIQYLSIVRDTQPKTANIFSDVRLSIEKNEIPEVIKLLIKAYKEM